MHQALVGLSDWFDAEDRRKRVEQAAGRCRDEPAGIVRGQKGTGRLQRRAPAQLANVTMAPSVGEDASGGVRDVGVLVPPSPGDPGRCRGTVGAQSNVDGTRRSVVEITPSLAEDTVGLGPWGPVAGQCKLGRLSETRLAGAIAPDDQGQARLRRQTEA